ncbi:MAG: class I tRNA ligase family protein [Bacilli bacterium]|nr:class I tRNA ligase family protein [Bacilli bacterium]
MYNFKEIETKWQKYWEDNKTYKFNMNNLDKKLYSLEMFSYPSGAKLHVGHWYNFGISDTWSRFKRMQGFEVFHPMGFDAFGLPAENYAIKTGVHPKDSTLKNIETMEAQLKKMGATYDWDYEVITCNPEYYKWTQWMFLQLYKNNLAYKKEAPVNWCPSCNTVLANEQVVNGTCERCKTAVERKKLSQWFFKITDYAEELLNGLDKLDWPERTKNLQRNWIGKSEGSQVSFKVDNSDLKFEVFTTRIDTLYGATYVVVAPESDLVDQITTDEYKEVVSKYRLEASKISEIDRLSSVKEKTGVFTGSYAINPINNKKIPIWVADYVIASYGTGVVMAVPAHDERDYEFAKKYGLEIIEVIERETGEKRDNEEYRRSIVALVKNPKTNEYLTINWGNLGGRLFIGGGLEENEDAIKCATREITEETGYTDLKYLGKTSTIHHHYYAHSKNKARYIDATGLYFELQSDNRIEQKLEADEKDKFKVEWVSKDIVEKEVNDMLHKAVYDNFVYEMPYLGDGILVNSEEMNGKNNREAMKDIIAKLEKANKGKFVTTYRLRDWLVSRQRYWGAPIPIIYCDDCGAVPVPEKDLPVELPYNVDFKPDGKSPLLKCEEFVNTTCPICGKKARREVDTLDTFVCSSWYFLRYPSAKNNDAAFDKDLINKLLPVDKYVGGVEHACMHLLYARFFVKALRDMGHLNFDEPFKSLVHQGVILGSDGEKMSKSKGNTVSPDEFIEQYGSDVFRTYLMFGFNYVDGGPWSSDGIKAIAKFFGKIDRLLESSSVNNDIRYDEIDKILNKSIKDITRDTERFQFNTAISRIMEYVNILSKYTSDKKEFSKYYLDQLVLLLAPFAPHLGEELWQTLGHNESVFTKAWPTYDESKIVEDSYEMIIQINGKVRGKVLVSSTTSEEEMKDAAMEHENVKKYLEEAVILKTIVIPKKLVNIVIK